MQGKAEPEVETQNVEELNETPVTIHVYNTLNDRISMEQAEAFIRQTMPNVTIEATFEIGPKMENAQLASVREGAGPEIIYTQDYYTYVQEGYLKDLTSESFLKNYMISSLNDAEVGGKVYALPMGNGCISGLMVNKRLLGELGYEMPETQEEFMELCRQIQAVSYTHLDVYKRQLHDYALFISRVRDNEAAGLLPAEAVDTAVTDCIRDGILADILSKNRAEVCDLLIFEYDEKKQREFEKEEGRAEGETIGRAKSVLELLEDLGNVPEELRSRILQETDLAVLKKWHKEAARAKSLEEFMEKL